MFFLSTLVVGCSVLGGGSSSPTSYIVPLYSYPGDSYYSNEWRKLFDFDSRGKKVEVIINAGKLNFLIIDKEDFFCYLKKFEFRRNLRYNLGNMLCSCLSEIKLIITK